MANSAYSSAIESPSQKKTENVINDNDKLKLFINEVISTLELDDNEKKDQILDHLLENGRQSLRRYQEDLRPKIYKLAMSGDDCELMKSLRNYFEQQWKVQYGPSNEWFILFLNQHHDDVDYRCVLNCTAEYGNKYIQNCPILSIVLQVLFEGIDHKCLNETNVFNDLLFTITNHGLKSITQYSDYIAKKRLDKLINKEQLVLFQALREYYRPELFSLLQESNIKDKDNLYESALDNVAEHGWLKGVQAIEDDIIPRYFKLLKEKIPSPKKKEYQGTPSAEDSPPPASLSTTPKPDDIPVKQVEAVSKTSSTNPMPTGTEMEQVTSGDRMQQVDKVEDNDNNINSRTESNCQSKPVIIPDINDGISGNILQSSSKSTRETLNDIEKKFTLQDRNVERIRHEVEELEQLQRECNDLNPAGVYLRKENYSDINVLNSEIEDLAAKKRIKIDAAEIEKGEKESRLKSLQLSLTKYRTFSSKAVDSDALRKLQDDYLKELRYSNIAAVVEAITKTKDDKEKYLKNVERNNKELSDSISRLESIRAEYKSLLDRSESTKAVIHLLQNRGFNSPTLLDQKIQEKKSIVDKLKKNKHVYNFSDGLDASAVNDAFAYISRCETVNDASVEEIAIDTKEILKTYIREYGNFLDENIKAIYNAIVCIGCEGNSFQYSDDLFEQLSQLSSLSRFEHVFECIDGAKKVENWHRTFIGYHQTLSDEMKKYQDDHKKKELRIRLHRADVLTCADKFCSAKLVEGFEILYRKYLVKADVQRETDYTNMTEYIFKGDYRKAAVLISDNCPCFSSIRYSTQIKHQLKSCLIKLMHEIESNTKWLEENIEKLEYRKVLEEMKDNNDNISKALEENSFQNLLDDTIKDNVEKFRSGMDQILSNIILRKIDAIEALLKIDHFVEAEQSMENLVCVQRELRDISACKSALENGEKLRERLREIGSEILNRDFQDVSRYSVNSPKEFLEKLKSAKEKYPAKYTELYENMLKKIRKTLDDAIKQIGSAPWNQRYAKLSSLEDALWHIPKDWEISFRPQIEKWRESSNIEESASRDELITCLQSVDTKEDAIIRLATLARRFDGQNMNELLRILHEEVLQKLKDYREKVKCSLDEQEMKSAVNIVQKIIKFNKLLSPYISLIIKISKDVCYLTTEAFYKCCNTLTNIGTFTETDIADTALDNMIVFIKFWMTLDVGTEGFSSEEILKQVMMALEKIYEFFYENSEKYKAAIPEINITELQAVMTVSKRWDEFLRKLRKFCENNSYKPVQKFSEALAKLTLYEDMRAELEKNVDNLKSQLNIELISEDTVLFAEKRATFFRNLTELIKKLRAVDSKLKDFLPPTFDKGKLEGQLKKKIQTLGEQLLHLASKEDLTSEESNKYRINYEHLLAFAIHVNLEEIDTRTSFLDKSEEKILAHVTSMRKTIESSISTTKQVAEMLCRMKFFAENLSMFDTKINAQVNDALTAYEEKSGSAGLEKLALRLQNTEIGARMISEQPLLRGLDWRLRREKMQNQDNLDYILGLLQGDDVDTSVLKDSYGTFRKKYDDLVSSNLECLDQQDQTELSLDTLIKNTKDLVGTVAHNLNTVNWTQSFKGKIAELLAYIFSIWTLKNTAYYNAARGIESKRAYLLIPHVAQVIAIFRILGIGYHEVSYKLVNNLVEISTGEGKSVVMAVTACIFALLGMDVNCSCYSEILSVRDKENFASLFKALKIEERIEYGTFNKLCENLLNEQCNVREKVSQMILGNKDRLAAVGTTEAIRRKILFIDEIDVFLSDKFYGGMYVPSVYLKHPAINALLDTIWEQGTGRTLMDIKSMPAYTACATHFSNWTLLLDEAVKDMVAALKSFQSSTYIVQNDRIVYVEDESIVENVVRGYDTIWAYYYEFRKGRISLSSLKSNVGIIVNCGTFSYAEMPHDFAYITGVTGTLRTLADSEKRILETVYDIHKNTFMPSVFASCRRIYNCKNDVRAVKESEYFMEIRGEINTICDAQRAILVFFECEEKLMMFYHSTELSSLRKDVQIVTERISAKDRDLFIKRALTIGKVTLLTRNFGRGTDFMCHNQPLLANGGIHVLQTFFADELSEDYQIMGRGARQGDRGSYSMILLDKDLEWILGAAWEKILPDILGTKLYETLNTARNALYESKCGAKQLSIEQCKKEHEASRRFMNALSAGEMENVKKFLMTQNRSANLVLAPSRTLLLMDATGSMSNLLSAVKETVCTMFERASDILKEKNLPSDTFQMQFVVYRDYDCKEEGLLQSSSWETNPTKLRSFMTNIHAKGGGDYEEAIEIGLWHAVQQSQGLSQVILIGDAPAKDSRAIDRDRRATGGDSYWGATKFTNPTHYTNEMRKLKEKKIPVFAFYLHDGAKVNFEQIACETGGTCKFLDIKSAQGAELLTNFVTQEVLRKTAGVEGEAAVALYEAKYVRRTFTS